MSHRLTPRYVGSVVTIQAVRYYLLDHHLTTDDTILLHPADYEALAREYQQTYREALPSPYFLLNIYVEAATPDHPVPAHRVSALLQDRRPHSLALALRSGPLTDDHRPLYRCGRCGTYIDAEG